MLQATPSMVNRVHEETGLLVHHIEVGTELSVTRMDHIHISVTIPEEDWPKYRIANEDNYITPELRQLDDEHVKTVLQLVEEGKYDLSERIIHYIVKELRYEYTVYPKEGRLIVTHFDERHVFDIAKLFKRAEFDNEYIAAFLG